MFNGIEKYGDSVALASDEGSVTYSQLVADADKIARLLPRRSLVMVLCSNTVGAIAGYVGFLRNGIIPIMLSSSLESSMVEGILDVYKPVAVYAPSGASEGEVLGECHDYSLLRHPGGVHSVIADDLALLLSTSGSTGSPKLVRLTEKNIEANTASIIEYLEIGREEVAITTLPLNYTYGLSILNTHLIAGARVVVTEKTLFDTEIWDMIKKQHVTSFGGVPYTFEMLKRLHFFDIDLPSLRYITQAGGKLSSDLQVEFATHLRSKGKRFIVMYGATEATARMSYLPADLSVEKAGSIGIAIPGGRFEIRDDDGMIVDEPGMSGELIYYGPNVSPGYAEDLAGLSKGDEREGRLVTGDLAVMDADEFYSIVGRKSRFLKMYGNRVDLGSLEDSLRARGYEVACVGKDNDLHVYTTHKDDSEVRAETAHLLHMSKTGITVTAISEIPRSESGKILYSKLNG